MLIWWNFCKVFLQAQGSMGKTSEYDELKYPGGHGLDVTCGLTNNLLMLGWQRQRWPFLVWITYFSQVPLNLGQHMLWTYQGGEGVALRSTCSKWQNVTACSLVTLAHLLVCEILDRNLMQTGMEEDHPCAKPVIRKWSALKDFQNL